MLFALVKNKRKEILSDLLSASFSVHDLCSKGQFKEAEDISETFLHELNNLISSKDQAKDPITNEEVKMLNELKNKVQSLNSFLQSLHNSKLNPLSEIQVKIREILEKFYS